MSLPTSQDSLMARTKLALSAIFLCAAALAACGDMPAPSYNGNPDAGPDTHTDTDMGEQTCGVEGATQACTCVDGSAGAQQCLASGGWTACQCDSEPQPPIDCVVGEWRQWGACSAECGGGSQTRTRPILLDAANGGAACPALEEVQPCNTQACPGCDDHIQNGDEEGVDCGGVCDMMCPGIRLDGVDIAGQGESAELIAGAYFDVELDYAVSTPDCADCATQLLIIVEAWVVNVANFTSGWEVTDAACVYDGVPGYGAPLLGSALATLQDTGFESATVRVVQTRAANCDVALDQVRNASDGLSQGYELGPITRIAVPEDFEIQHVDSGLCLDVSGGSLSNRAEVITYPCTGNANQRFNLNYLFTAAGAARYRVQANHSGLCFDITGGIAAVEDNRTLQQYECVGAENQHFELRARRGGYSFVPVHSRKCLDVPNNSHDSGAIIQQYNCHDHAAQVFALTNGL